MQPVTVKHQRYYDYSEADNKNRQPRHVLKGSLHLLFEAGFVDELPVSLGDTQLRSVARDLIGLVEDEIIIFDGDITQHPGVISLNLISLLVLGLRPEDG